MNYKDFEQHISQEILLRGKDYFENRAVEDLTKEDGYWLANVRGSEIYDVAIKGIRSIKEWDCDCPYDHGPICKHVTAVLYAVQTSNATKAASKPSKKKNQADEIFKNAKPEDLLSFFKKNLRYHKDLKQKFLAEFLQVLDASDKDRYNKIVDSMIKNAGGRHGYIDYREGKGLSSSLDRFLKQAETAVQKKNYVDALDMCAAIILKIPSLLQYVDDSSGALQGSCHYALNILNSLLERPIAPVFKDQLFEFMLHAFEKDETDFDFKDDMLRILLKQEWEDSKLKRIQEVVKKVFNNLKGNYIEYSQSFYIGIMIALAKRLKAQTEADALINQYIHFPRIRQMKLSNLLEKEDYETAKQLIIDGIKVAEDKRHPGTVRQWKDLLIKISRLEKDIETERKLLREAFFENHRSMEYFLQLKDTFDLADWFEEREKIISKILGKNTVPDYNNAHTLGQIYVEEKFWERLLDLSHSEKISSYVVSSFGHHLHQDYPEEMLLLYKSMMINEASRASSRSNYRKVAENLKELLKIRGGREVVVELLQKFRDEYAKRPAMMDELSRVL